MRLAESTPSNAVFDETLEGILEFTEKNNLKLDRSSKSPPVADKGRRPTEILDEALLTEESR